MRDEEKEQFIESLKTLRQQIEEFKEWINALDTFVVKLDRDGMVLFCNQALVRAVGITADEVYGKYFPDTKWFSHSETEQGKITASLQKAEAGISTRIETSLRSSDGIPVPIIFDSRPIKDKEGNVKYISVEGKAIAKEITLRKELLKAKENLEKQVRERTAKLSESEGKYRNLIENSQDGFVIIQDGKLVFINEAMSNILNYAEEEIIGRDIANFMPPAERERALKNIRKVIKKGGITLQEYKITTKDGQIKQMQVTLSSIKYEGKPAIQTVVRDITEYKQIEKALRESESKYRELVQNANSIILRMDTKGYVTFFNEFAQSFFGYAEHEILGRNVVGTIAPETDTSGRNIALMIEDIGQHPERYAANENENMRRSGERVWIAWTNKAILDDQGRIVETLSVGNDITARKQIEETLRQSEEKYRTLIENIQDGVFLIQDRKIKYFNEAFARILGCTAEEIVGKDFSNFVAPEDLEMVGDRYIQMMAGEDVPMEYEFHGIRKNDAERTTVHMTVGLINYQGRPAALGTVKDITARKQMEEALAAERERLAVTFRSIGDGLIATDAKGRVVIVNKVAEKLTDWTQEEALGKPLNGIFYIINEETRQRCENPFEKVIETRGVVGLANNTILVARDGTERAIADSGAPILDKKGKIIGVILVFRDVTEKRKMQQELIKADKLESVGILAGGIAHDFNNILTGILGNITLAKCYATSEEKIVKRLEESEKACLRAKDLTQQLLIFSKGGEPVKKTVFLAELVRETAHFVLSGSNVRCEFSIPDDLWSVEADEGQISQVINNLLINADQAMPAGGIIEVYCENVIVEVKTYLPLEKGKYVKISIRDHGIGVFEEHLSRIFDPYFTTKQRGSGLGLATTYSIIKRHGGHVKVESEVGVGTTFCIYLPASEEKMETLEEETTEAISGAGKILLMDDEELILEVVGEMLSHLGYEAEFARDGLEAIELYTKAKDAGHPFAAVIMDLTIPGGMGGKEAVKKLIEIDPHVKAIVSSGYSTDPIMADFRKYGFCRVITKPFKLNELSEVLQRGLSSK